LKDLLLEINFQFKPLTKMVTLLGSRKASIASLLLIVASHSISSGNAAVIDRTPSAHIQGRGCINTVPTWTIGSFNHEVNNGVSTVKFILNSNTAQGQLTCSGQAPSGHSVQISGNCNSEQVAAQFAFDTASESLRINQVSACDGGATSIP
jgi:hypothetical protein